jgi:O-antigen/teichoic acid export membrane protein
MRSVSETSGTYRLDNYIWFSASSALMLAGPFCVVVILSRMGSPVELGLYAYAYAVTAPVQAFAGLHARAFIAMDRLFGYDVADVLAQRVYLGLLLVVTALTAAALHGGDMDELGVFLGIVLVRVAEACTDVSTGQLQRAHRPRLIALLYAVRGVGGLGIFAALIAAHLPLGLALSSMGVVNLLAFLLVDRALLASIGAAPSLPGVVDSLASARPFRLGRHLLPGALLAALSVVETNLPRYAADALRGIEAVGVYTTLGMLLSVATNVVHPVFFMTFARLGQAAQHDDPESRRFLARVIWTNAGLTIASGALLVALCVGFGSSIVVGVFGSEWERFHGLFIVLAVGASAGLLRSCLGFALTGLNIFAPQIAITVGSGLIFVVLAVGFGGRTDLIAVGQAWAVASLLAVGANAAILGAALRRRRSTVAVSVAAGAHLGG